MDHIDTLRIKTVHYIITGFALVVGLSWNEFVKKIIDSYFPDNTHTIMAKLLYSLAITLLFVIIMAVLPDTSRELPKKIQRLTYV